MSERRQAAGCSPVVTALRRQHVERRAGASPNTIAKSLAIGNPADGYYALKIDEASPAAPAESVSDDEIVEGIKLLAETEGIFAETAGGVTVAGLRRLVQREQVGKDEVVVAFITGAGLKTQEAVADALPAPLMVQPTMESFEAALLERHGGKSPVGV